MTLRTRASIEDAVIAWIALVHPSVVAILGWPSAPRPDLPYISARVTVVDAIGQDDRMEIDSDGVQTIYGDRLATVKLDAFGDGALDLIRTLRTSIWKTSVSSVLLETYGLAPQPPGPVNDLTGLLDSDAEERAHVDMIFGLKESYTDDVGIIAVVDGDGTVLDDGGNELTVQVDGILGDDLPLLYAAIYANGNATATTFAGAGIANKALINIWDANGPYAGATPDYANGKITIDIAGTYRVDWHAAFSGGANDTIGFGPWLDATELLAAHVHRKLGAGGDIGAVAGSCLVVCAAGEIIRLYAYNEDDNSSITVQDAGLSVVRIA